LPFESRVDNTRRSNDKEERKREGDIIGHVKLEKCPCVLVCQGNEQKRTSIASEYLGNPTILTPYCHEVVFLRMKGRGWRALLSLS